MRSHKPQPQATGLQFFGRISAAVSHDLKNVLSIINEKTGLLEDFCFMARRGGSVDMDRVNAIAAQVKTQVARADQIIRRFNRFAHTTDHPVAATDLGETAASLVMLAQRLLSHSEVTVTVLPADPPVVIATRPLLVQELIWVGLEWAIARGDQSREIPMAVEAAPDGATVRLGPLSGLPGDVVDDAFLADTTPLREALQADLSGEAATGCLLIHLTALEAP
jgi:light-regulated signal transduction histidine kinase (bacteriophytochrome)